MLELERECHRWRSLEMIPAISKAKTPTILLDLKEVVFFRSNNLGFDFNERQRDFFLFEINLNSQVIFSFLHFGFIIEKCP